MIFIAMIFGLIVKSSIFVIVCQRPHINSAELSVKTLIYLGKIKQKNRIRSNITCLDLIMRLSVILFFFFLRRSLFCSSLSQRVSMQRCIRVCITIIHTMQSHITIERRVQHHSYIHRPMNDWFCDFLRGPHVLQMHICLCVHEIGFNCSTKVMTERFHTLYAPNAC